METRSETTQDRHRGATSKRWHEGVCEMVYPHQGGVYMNLSLEGLMLKLQYFGHLMQRTESLEKP